MIVESARNTARSWVRDEACRLPGFRGALWHGSIITLPDRAMLPASSDIDIVLVVDDPDMLPKPGKFDRDGVLLDVSLVTWAEIESPERVLANHSLAPTLRNPEIIADPTGAIAAVQREVAAHFAERVWVERRCASARDRLTRNLDSIEAARPYHDNVMAWLFGTGITSHVLLVAGLRNPTVRKRYLAARELLSEHVRLDVYEELLWLLGCTGWTPATTMRHLDELAEAYDAAAAVIRTPVFFASDISPRTRDIAIGGSRELIEAGDHREAVFWIVATWARCMTVFHTDAPALVPRFESGFAAVLADLGIASLADLQRNAAELERYLPHLMDVAGAILDVTADIRD